MKTFKFCYPDANTFKDIMKFKTLDNWNYEYIKLDGDIGYWVAENPFEGNGFDLFKELISSFPVQKDNNHPDNRDPNPFDTIHLPEWVSTDLCLLIRDFYFKNVTDLVQASQIHEWGNLYFKERSRPISCWRIPHIDYVYGLVSNLWFTSHPLEDSCTRIYRYHGKIHNDVYDFQIDEDHPLSAEWKTMADTPKRLDAWNNIPEEELRRWGFEWVGSAPCTEKTMTLYRANVCHNPFITENVNFRWSHSFAYSHEKLENTTLKDLFR